MPAALAVLPDWGGVPFAPGYVTGSGGGVKEQPFPSCCKVSFCVASLESCWAKWSCLQAAEEAFVFQRLSGSQQKEPPLELSCSCPELFIV